MANRTTEALVKRVLEVRDTIEVEPFIEIANNLVTKYIVGECGASYSAKTLEHIERYLAAYYYTERDRRLSQESTGPTGGTYQGQTGMGYDSNSYGQMAKQIDYLGCLAKLDAADGARTVGMGWAGTKPTDRETDFWR